MDTGDRKHPIERILFWGFIVLLSAWLFLSNTSNQLGSDDMKWITGSVPTVYDTYRVVPFAIFANLVNVFGSNLVAVYTMMFIFHMLNAVLLYRVSYDFLENELASTITTIIFLINPVTLGTLTWISCFSYVLGLTFGLLVLLGGWQYLRANLPKQRLFWSLFVIITYIAGLFSAHILLFLPAIFLPLAWLHEKDVWQRGLFLAVTGLVVGFLIYTNLYYFRAYAPENDALLSGNFLTAYVSSNLALLPMLMLAYLLSFIGDTLGFLMLTFEEPLRWGFGLLMLGGIGLYIQFQKNSRRLLTILALFVLLITPYIIRLYLSSDFINYHPSYMLTGRVFYIPFIAVAMLIGHLSATLLEKRKTTIIALATFFAAMFIYLMTIGSNAARFQGLTVVRGVAAEMPPSWTPFTNEHPILLISIFLLVFIVLSYRYRSHVSQIKEQSYESIRTEG